MRQLNVSLVLFLLTIILLFFICEQVTLGYNGTTAYAAVFGHLFLMIKVVQLAASIVSLSFDKRLRVASDLIDLVAFLVSIARTAHFVL